MGDHAHDNMKRREKRRKRQERRLATKASGSKPTATAGAKKAAK